MFDNKKKTVYLMVVKDLTTNEEVIESYEYDSIEECKADFKMYTSDVEKPIGFITREIKEYFQKVD